MKFFTPNLYKTSPNECDKMANLDENSPAPDGQFDLLPLIGESHLAAYQNINNQIKTQHASPSEFDDTSRASFCVDQKTNQDSNVECT